MSGVAVCAGGTGRRSTIPPTMQLIVMMQLTLRQTVSEDGQSQKTDSLKNKCGHRNLHKVKGRQVGWAGSGQAC